MHRARPRCMPLAAALAFDDLGALILGHPALHLQEEVVFWTLAQGPVQKNHLYPCAPEFVDQQDLIDAYLRAKRSGACT